MTKYSGKDLDVAFKGTNIEGYGQSLEVTEDCPALNTTCFGEGDETYVSSAVHDHKASFQGLDGTVEGSFFDVVVQGAEGTLAIYPQGSATTKPSIIASTAIVTSRKRTIAVKDTVKLTADWQISGDVTEGTVA